MIDICVQNNNTVALKENLSKFRNYFQHQSMTLLESVFRYLIRETKQIMTDIEKTEGTQKICSLLSDDMSSGLPETEQAIFQQGDATAEQLILLANCDLDELIERNKLMPRINFFLESFKIILDATRQNYHLLELYNISAAKLLEFCYKFKCKKEFNKVSEILHEHFKKLRQQKQPDKGIPYPVTLKDEECTEKLLEVR